MAEIFRQPYLDSSVYIAAIRQEADRVDTAERILQDARAGQIQLVASTFVITEVYKGRDRPPLTTEQEQVIDDYFQHEFITWVELDMLVARDARRLARQHGLKPPDAVHLASAIKGGADQLLRWDDKFRLKDGHYEGVTVCEPHLVRPTGTDPRPGHDAVTKPGESKQNGRLSIPLPFEEAVRAALGVKPPPKPPKKQRPAKLKQPKG